MRHTWYLVLLIGLMSGMDSWPLPKIIPSTAIFFFAWNMFQIAVCKFVPPYF